MNQEEKENINFTISSLYKMRDFIRETWRPGCAVVYCIICFFDFVAFPIMWSILQAHYTGAVSTQWQCVTLQGSGLFHLGFGGILSVSAFSRNKEKQNETQ